MSQTSILAYQSLTKDKINTSQGKVLEAIEDYAPVCDRQLAELMNWGINRVTPRRGELLKMNKIAVAYVGVDITGRKVTYWEPKGGSYELANIG
jgi:hypothetical protein